MGRRYAPRRLGLEETIKILVGEHVAMKDAMRRMREAAGARDYRSVKELLAGLERVFRQHVVDEESEVLGFLVENLGAKGAEDEMRVFRQHRPIYGLMVRVGELADLSSEELAGRQAELEELFGEHAKAEEEQVFPRARSLLR